jgi:hypothetical protein
MINKKAETTNKAMTETAESHIGYSKGTRKAPNFLTPVLKAKKLNIRIMRHELTTQTHNSDKKKQILKILSNMLKDYKKTGIRNRKLTGEYFKMINKLPNKDLIKLVRKKRSQVIA